MNAQPTIFPPFRAALFSLSSSYHILYQLYSLLTNSLYVYLPPTHCLSPSKPLLQPPLRTTLFTLFFAIFFLLFYYNLLTAIRFYVTLVLLLATSPTPSSNNTLRRAYFLHAFSNHLPHTHSLSHGSSLRFLCYQEDSYHEKRDRRELEGV